MVFTNDPEFTNDLFHTDDLFAISTSKLSIKSNDSSADSISAGDEGTGIWIVLPAQSSEKGFIGALRGLWRISYTIEKYPSSALPVIFDQICPQVVVL